MEKINMSEKYSDYTCCDLCPRLVEHRQSIRPKASLFDSYWGKPVPPFGDNKDAWLLIVGMAPGAHGANRTGRPFTGDAAGVLLYLSLYKTGLSNKPDAVSCGDGLILNGALITNAVWCVPPQNKLTMAEVRNCNFRLNDTISSLSRLTDILCIGRDAHGAVEMALNFKSQFKHGSCEQVGGLRVWDCFHTSGYNQSTKRISLPDVVGILNAIKGKAGK